MFKQLLQAEAIDVVQIDAARVGGVNENIAILLLAAKFGVPVCPHAGGVGLCELVQHLSMFDYVAVSRHAGRPGDRVRRPPARALRRPGRGRGGRYRAPIAPGAGIEMLAARWPNTRSGRRDGEQPDRLAPLGLRRRPTVGNLYRACRRRGRARVLDAAWDAGIRYFDTAPHYGLGLSERRLGAFLGDRPREEFVVSTKVGRLLRPDPDARRAATTANCSRCPPTTGGSGTSPRRRPAQPGRVAGAARPRPGRRALPARRRAQRPGLGAVIDSGVAALARLREEGLVRAIGVGRPTSGPSSGPCAPTPSTW